MLLVSRMFLGSFHFYLSFSFFKVIKQLHNSKRLNRVVCIEVEEVRPISRI